MDYITRELEFDYGHRVPKHESKCKNLHGHRGHIIIELCGEFFTEGPQTDMILDYSIMKELLMTHVDAKIDHGIILSLTDRKFLEMAFHEESGLWYGFSDWMLEVHKEVIAHRFWSGITKFGKTYIIQGSPTAEILAGHFFNVLAPIIEMETDGKAILSAVTFKETPATSATHRQ